jgi:ureidoglycolate hydrolase
MSEVEQFVFEDPGYQKLFHFNSWRVAMLNHIHELEENQITYVEAHILSDEAFVLLEGCCTVVIAKVHDHQITAFKAFPLEKHTVLKVRKGVYHTQILSLDAKVLIIEEDSTDQSNSVRIVLDSNQQKSMMNALEDIKYGL